MVGRPIVKYHKSVGYRLLTYLNLESGPQLLSPIYSVISVMPIEKTLCLGSCLGMKKIEIFLVNSYQVEATYCSNTI